jgi:hypothetical protein
MVSELSGLLRRALLKKNKTPSIYSVPLLMKIYFKYVGLTLAIFHVWAWQARSGRAEMRSHRWITNGQHQA